MKEKTKKMEIFYFSGTGNSLWVAKEFAKKIDGCKLTPIKSLKGRVVPKAEQVGIVFPLYAFGCPRIVINFLKNLDVKNTKYLFSILTRGGSPTIAFTQVARALDRKLNSCFKINMGSNYLPFGDIYDQAKERKVLLKAQEKLDKIIPMITSIEEKRERECFLLYPILSYIYKSWSKRSHKSDKRFFVDDKCNSCGICEKICPVNNIELKDKKPLWLHKCQECLACLHYCPSRAIQVNAKSSGYGRYHHPDVSWKEISK